MLIVTVSTLLLAGGARAIDPARTIDQLNHTSWTRKDGAPSDILAMAQTPDGYLWLGSTKGLYRFDGVSFEKMSGLRDLPARSDGVVALMAAKSGDLWIGHDWGGVTVYRDGRFVDVNPAPPHGAVFRIREDPSGAVWVATDGIRRASLRRFYDGHWDIIEKGDWNLPETSFHDIAAGSDGTVWLSLGSGLMRLAPGSRAFELVEGPREEAEEGALAVTPDGTLWSADPRGIRPRLVEGRVEQATGKRTNAPRIYFGNLIVDRDGSLWAVNIDQGIFRVRHPGSYGSGKEAGEEEMPLAASGAILEDREGNIWVGTKAGLDRFQAVSFVAEIPGKPIPVTMNILQTRDGDVYGLSRYETEGRLFRDHAGAVTDWSAHAARAMAICAARDGGVWIAGLDRSLVHVREGKVVGTVIPPPPLAPMDPYRNCAEDGAGRLWLSMPRAGLMRYDGASWTRFDLGPDMKGIWPWLQTVDRQGRVLMYFGTRSLMRVDGDKVETIWDKKDISIRFINAIHVAGDLVFLCGERGLALYDGSTVRILDPARFPYLSHVNGITRTETGETWIFTDEGGVIRLSSRELDLAFDHPEADLHPRIFNIQDGVRGESRYGDGNAIAAARDGRIWLATTGGLEWLDTDHLYQNDLPPPVLIRAVEADGSRYAPQRRLTMPEGVSNLEFDYTAPSLTVPERVVFRYRLAGFDKNWIEAGTRRQAFYTNLPPGAYRFQVIAANNDGVWNMTGAAVDLEIPPTFTQSKWFAALCAAAVLGLLWLLYHLRIRQVAARLHMRMNARVEERERIARELHDTLLQSVQGLIFRFQAIATQMAPEQGARAQMDQALDQADELLAEGRDRLSNLRAAQAAGNLHELFDESASRILAGSKIEVRLSVEGPPAEISPLAAEELMRIGDEFLFNTLQHAEARNVEIAINYGRKSLALTLCDDGRGIDAAVLEQGGRDGHFGLRGMRERAKKLRAGFRLMSRPGAGVELIIAVPASVAYPRRRRRWTGLGLFTRQDMEA